MLDDRDLGNFTLARPRAGEPAQDAPGRPEGPEVGSAPELDAEGQEWAAQAIREAESMTTLDPQSLIRQVFGAGHSFVRGWAPKSAGIDPISGFAGHSGVDIAAAKGTPVYALAGGTVNFAGNGGGLDPGSWSSAAKSHAVNGGGLTVSVAGGDADNTRLQYAHLSAFAVSDGQKVNPGDLIGYVGSTGISTGPHLLFVIRQGAGAGVAIDPLPFLAGIASSGWTPYTGQGAYQAAVAANQAQAQAAQAREVAALSGGGGGGAPRPAPRAATPAASSSILSGPNSELVILALLGAAILALILFAGQRSEAPA